MEKEETNNTTLQDKVLVDGNGKPIPQCNINTDDTHLYVENQESFKFHKKKADFHFNLSVFFGTLCSLFLWIFTLNFSSNAWSMGNIVTFFVMLISGVGTLMCLKQWNMSSNLIQQMIVDGSPCQMENDDKKNIYCGYKYGNNSKGSGNYLD